MPEMLACRTKSGAGGKTRLSVSTDSMVDAMSELLLEGRVYLMGRGRRNAAAALRKATLADGRLSGSSCSFQANARSKFPARSPDGRPAAVHLHEPLAAGPALPRPHCRAMRLRRAVL